MTSTKPKILEDLLEKVQNSLIERIVDSWGVYVKNDVDIRFIKDEEYRSDEWYSFLGKILDEVAPKSDEELLKFSKECGNILAATVGLFVYKNSQDNISPSNSFTSKIIKSFIIDKIDENRDFILAVSLDRLANVISEDFDKDRFSDSSYFIELIEKLNLGYPIIFADMSVRDNPNVMLKAFNKNEWFFDMSSQRLKDLSFRHSPKEVLEKDILRMKLEDLLDTNSGQQRILKV